MEEDYLNVCLLRDRLDLHGLDFSFSLCAAGLKYSTLFTES